MRKPEHPSLLIFVGISCLAPCLSSGCASQKPSGGDDDTTAPDCNYYTHEYSCEGNILNTCSAEGQEEQIDCSAMGGVCVEGEPGCILPDDECTLDYYGSYCSSDTVVVYFRRRYGPCMLSPCTEGQRCIDFQEDDERWDGDCVLEDMIACDESSFEDRCADDTTRETCYGGYLAWRPCTEGERCIDGLCRFPDAEICDADTSAERCDGDATINCRYGYARRFPCGAGSTCQMIDDNRALCVADPPTPCDETTVQVECVQRWAARVCVEGYITYVTCDTCTCDEGGCGCYDFG